MELTKWNKMCKMKQYLNYIPMIKNHLEIPMIFLSKLKTFIQKGQTYKTAIAELFSKNYN